MSRHLKILAHAYPSTKFVSIRGDMCIANYPDKNIPTLLIYRKGQLIRQVVGLGAENGLKGMKTGVVGESSNFVSLSTSSECCVIIGWDGFTDYVVSSPSMTSSTSALSPLLYPPIHSHLFIHNTHTTRRGSAAHTMRRCGSLPEGSSYCSNSTRERG